MLLNVLKFKSVMSNIIMLQALNSPTVLNLNLFLKSCNRTYNKVCIIFLLIIVSLNQNSLLLSKLISAINHGLRSRVLILTHSKHYITVCHIKLS